MALIPRLERLQLEHADKLVILGIHCQSATKDEILAIAKSQKITYSILNQGQIKGKNFSGIPHAFLFDAKGELIAEGHPDEFMKKIDEACKNAPDWLLGGHEYTKLKTQASAVTARKGVGKVLADCRKMSTDADKTTAQEAGWLKDSLEKYAKSLLDQAKQAETSDPPKALELYTKASALFAGDELGTQAADTLKKLKADPAFKKEVDASTMLKQVQNAMDGLKPCKYGQPLDLANCSDCKKKNAEAMAGLVAQLKAIVQKYDGTNAAKEAADLLKSWGA